MGFLKYVSAIGKGRFMTQDEEGRIPLIPADGSSTTLTKETLEYFSRVERRHQL